MTQKSLEGRVAVVTGASRGFGREIALALGEAGATVVLVARTQQALESVAAEIASTGGQALPLPADLTNESAIHALRDRLTLDPGRVDILVNNAGINLRKSLVDFTLAEWRSVMDTNLTSVFLLCRALIPLMRGRDYGRILNLGSTMAHVSIPGRCAYSASKAGVLGLTRALALELAPEHITVNSLSPGPFATEMNRPLLENEELNRQFLTRIPLGRWGQPHDLGAIVRFFCSPEAGFVTGADLVIDGGWLAQ